MNSTDTDLIFILDRSGSMAGLEQDTIGGFNAMIERQKKLPGQAYVTTLVFNHRTEVIHNRIPLQDLPPMTEEDYCPGGSTALLDAIGSAISSREDLQGRKDDLPRKVLFVITTDGMENASRHYRPSRIREMVEAHREEGWEFLFLGANMDAFRVGSRLGIPEDRTAVFCSDKKGTEVNYRAIGRAAECLRRNQPLSTCWKEEIQKDFRERKQK